MINKDLVSVIIPTYNVRTDKLKKTIDSVLNQTYEPIEILVVDDGSKEPFGLFDTLNYANSVKKTYPHKNIQFVAPGKHFGLAGIKNLGIKTARGDFIAFLDCGDWWDKNKIQEQIDCFKKGQSDCGMVYCGAKVVSVQNNIIKELYDMCPSLKGNNLYKIFLVYNKITGSNSSVLIKRMCFEKVGLFYDIDDIPEDIEMWARIAKEFSIDFVKKCLTFIEKDSTSMSSDPEKKKQTYLRYYTLQEKELKKYGLWEKAMAQYYSIIGKKYFMRKQFLKGLQYFYLSFKHGIYKETLYKFLTSIFEGIFNSYKVIKFVRYLTGIHS